jgi:hypothetical protein
MNQTPVHAADVFDFRAAALDLSESPLASRADAARVDGAFGRTEEIAVLNQWEDGDPLSLAALDRTDLTRSPLGELASGIIPAMMPGVEGSLGAPAELLERQPAPADFTLAVAGEPESGGGGDSPNQVGKSSPVTPAPATTQGTPPAQTSPSNPVAPQVPAPSVTGNALSSADANALAHGLSSPSKLSPSSPAKHGSHVSPLSIPNINPGILAVGADAGSAPTVKVYNAQTLKLQFTINAYASTFTGGVRVAVGVNGDGSTEIITAPGPGGGSLIKVWSGSTGALLQSFSAYNPGQTDGVYVAAGDVNGDGHTDIITGTDAGAQPLVKVFSGVDDSLLTSFVSDPLAGANGVRVAVANVDGDGTPDIITGAGPGGPPRVTVVDGATGQEIYNFFAYDETFTGGVYVAAGDLDGDGHADIITGPGSAAPWVHAYRGLDERPMANFLAYDASFAGGVRVGAVDPNGSGLDQILTGAGPGGRELRVFSGQDFTQQVSPFPKYLPLLMLN